MRVSNDETTRSDLSRGQAGIRVRFLHSGWGQPSLAGMVTRRIDVEVRPFVRFHPG